MPATPGLRMKSLRERLGLSQARFATLAGVAHATTVSRWETGRSTPQMGNLRSLAESFRTPFADLRAFIERGEGLDARAIDLGNQSWSPPRHPPAAEPARDAEASCEPKLARAPAREAIVADGAMEPEFRAGDRVIAGSSVDSPVTGAPCVVELADERVVVRYVFAASATLMELRPGNHRHPSRLVKRETIRSISPIVEIRRVVYPPAPL